MLHLNACCFSNICHIENHGQGTSEAVRKINIWSNNLTWIEKQVLERWWICSRHVCNFNDHGFVEVGLISDSESIHSASVGLLN